LVGEEGVAYTSRLIAQHAADRFASASVGNSSRTRHVAYLLNSVAMIGSVYQ